MEEIIWQLWQFGLLWTMLWILILYIIRLSNSHREERWERKLQSEKQHEQLLEVIKDTHTILSEMKIMIQNLKK